MKAEGAGLGRVGGDPVAAAAAADPGRRALTEGGETLTYEDLDRRVGAWARWLEGKGVGPRTRVALTLPPSATAVTLVHAAWRTGAAVSPLHPGWPAAEARAAVRALDPDLVVEADPDAPLVFAEVPRDAGLRVLPRRRCRPPGEREGQEERMALLLRTSGSDGQPRGVALSHGNLEALAQGAGERLDLGPDDRWLLSLHPAHVGGAALLHRAAWTGAELVVDGSFEPGAAARLLDAQRVTHLSLVPVMLERLMRARGGARAPDALRLVLLGGQAPSRRLLRRSLEAGYPVAVTYGLTEAASQVATAPPELVRRKPGTVGSPLPGVEVTAVGEEEGRAGEIRVRGPTVALGVAEGGVEGLSVLADREGWLATGDAGRFDADGHLWVTGRLSRRIISGGVTVDPAEVETALLDVSGVQAVHVLGRPDPEWGERPEAAVEPAPDVDPQELGRRVAEHARRHLSPAKRPRAFHFQEALPRTATGKVDGAAVARLLGAGSAEVGRRADVGGGDPERPGGRAP